MEKYECTIIDGSAARELAAAGIQDIIECFLMKKGLKVPKKNVRAMYISSQEEGKTSYIIDDYKRK